MTIFVPPHFFYSSVITEDIYFAQKMEDNIILTFKEQVNLADMK